MSIRIVSIEDEGDQFLSLGTKDGIMKPDDSSTKDKFTFDLKRTRGSSFGYSGPHSILKEYMRFS